MEITMEVQSFFNKLWNRVAIQERLGFMFTFFGGILVNLFMFTNKTGNHDDIINEFSYNDGFDISSGRWMWIPLRKLATYYDMPMVKGMLACLLLALSVAMLIHVVSIRENVFVLAISLLFASFPVNACFFSYLSISEIYYFAIFFIMLSISLVHWAAQPVNRQSRAHACLAAAALVAAAVLVALALGTYQSMLCLFVAIAFTMAFAEIMHENTCLKNWFLKYVTYFLVCAGGYVIYYILTKIITARSGIGLRSYAGTDQMFRFAPSLLGKSLLNNYRQMYRFFLTTDYVNRRLYVIANALLILAVLAVVLMNLIRLVKNRHVTNAMVLVVLTLLSPVFLDMIEVVMNDKSSAHVLMRYSNIIFYVLAVTVVTRGVQWTAMAAQGMDRVTKWVGAKCVALGTKCVALGTKRVTIVTQWLALLGLVLIIYYGALTSNQLYQRMYYNAKGMDGVALTLISQLSSVEGWSVDEPVCVIGFDNFFNENYESTGPFAMDLPPYSWIGTDMYDWYSTEHLLTYISLNQHLKLSAYDDADGTISNSSELADMPTFPDNGSVRRINGVVVVKFN
jgi:hypothetical protein